MPTYEYERPDGARVEKFFDMGRAKRRIRCPDGVIARRVFSAAQPQPRRWSRGLESVGCGVHPSQVADDRAISEKHGWRPEYTPDGNPIFRSRAQRKKFMRERGLIDRDGGYGDAT
jgi:hypothetical protein